MYAIFISRSIHSTKSIMETIRKESQIRVYKSQAELNNEQQELLQQAREAAQKAYAPYSRFCVGCALLLQNGEILTGNNQENIAYPSGLCAERVAIFHAGARYPDVPVRMMAITAFSEGYEVNHPVMSCGACLQSISEYEMKFSQPIQFILQGASGDIYVAEGTSTFLPFQFRLDELKGE